jgi:hypothetical protein
VKGNEVKEGREKETRKEFKRYQIAIFKGATIDLIRLVFVVILLLRCSSSSPPSHILGCDETYSL